MGYILIHLLRDKNKILQIIRKDLLQTLTADKWHHVIPRFSRTINLGDIATANKQLTAAQRLALVDNFINQIQSNGLSDYLDISFDFKLRANFYDDALADLLATLSQEEASVVKKSSRIFLRKPLQ
jgi:glutamate mutase epsilon subunit